MQEVTEKSTLSEFVNYYIYNTFGNLSYVFIRITGGRFAVYDATGKEVYETFPVKDISKQVKKFINAGARVACDASQVVLVLKDDEKLHKIKNVLPSLLGCSCKAPAAKKKSPTRRRK